MIQLDHFATKQSFFDEFELEKILADFFVVKGVEEAYALGLREKNDIQ